MLLAQALTKRRRVRRVAIGGSAPSAVVSGEVEVRSQGRARLEGGSGRRWLRRRQHRYGLPGPAPVSAPPHGGDPPGRQLARKSRRRSRGCRRDEIGYDVPATASAVGQVEALRDELDLTYLPQWRCIGIPRCAVCVPAPRGCAATCTAPLGERQRQQPDLRWPPSNSNQCPLRTTLGPGRTRKRQSDEAAPAAA